MKRNLTGNIASNCGLEQVQDLRVIQKLFFYECRNIWFNFNE